MFPIKLGYLVLYCRSLRGIRILLSYFFLHANINFLLMCFLFSLNKRQKLTHDLTRLKHKLHTRRFFLQFLKFFALSEIALFNFNLIFDKLIQNITNELFALLKFSNLRFSNSLSFRHFSKFFQRFHFMN